MLKAEPHSIAESTIEVNLTTLPGSATDPAAVKKLFDYPIDIVLFAIGGSPQFKLSLTDPVVNDQPTLCGDAMGVLVQTLKEAEKSSPAMKKPFVISISTTGVTDGAVGKIKDDVPLLMAPLYHWVLANPHKDKQVMEKTVAEATNGESSAFSGFAVVHPTLLTDGPAKGSEVTKVGWVDGTGKGPGAAMGYSISRADVGGFIYDKLLSGGFPEWNGRVITLTH
jgi:hypothetical protein